MAELIHYLSLIICYKILNTNISLYDVFIDIITICSAISVPFIINYMSQKNLDKQNEKILYDNKMNRIANLHSLLTMDKSAEIVIYQDTTMNYEELIKYNKPVLITEKARSKSIFSRIDIGIYFKNLTNIFPSEVLIEKIRVFINFEKSATIDLDLSNYEEKYKDFMVNDDNKSCISIICLFCDDNQFKLLNKLTSDNKINVEVNMKVKNSFGIISDLNIKSRFKNVDIQKNNKMKKILHLECEEQFLNIKGVSEVINNE